MRSLLIGERWPLEYHQITGLPLTTFEVNDLGGGLKNSFEIRCYDVGSNLK